MNNLIITIVVDLTRFYDSGIFMQSPSDDIRLVGLNLDEYCQQKHKAESLKKATHRNYKDPNSLYCVNPNLEYTVISITSAKEPQ